MYRKESITARCIRCLIVLFSSFLLQSATTQSQSTTIPTPASSFIASPKIDLYVLPESKHLTCNDLVHQKQREMCQRSSIEETDLFLHLLKHAEWVAAKECHRVFALDRWNCSGLRILQPYSITNYVTKEAAFVRALSVAALAHTIAMACGANLTTCQKPLVTEAPTPDADDRVIIQGIPENVTYGLQIAEEFFEAPIRSKQYISDRDYVILHNYRAGRLVLESYINPQMSKCRCHGISASCLVRTCYLAAPKFENITADLKEMYESSCYVYSNQLHGNRHLYISNCTKAPPRDNELVYFQASVNFCIKDIRRGSLGVSGRKCSLTSTGSDNCQDLCCGRGYRTHVVEEIVDCECRFVWCCRIECKKCRERQTFHTCI